MSAIAGKHFGDMNSGDAEPATIGRGSGMTLREINKRLKENMRRLGIGSRQWKTLKQKQAEARAAKRK